MKQCEAFFSLAVVFMAVFVLASCSNPAENKRLDGDAGANVGNDENTEAAKITYPLMVKINGQVYQGMAYVNNNVTCGTGTSRASSVRARGGHQSRPVTKASGATARRRLRDRKSVV